MSASNMQTRSPRLSIPGPPMSKGRPRFGRGRTYTPKQTEDAQKHIAERWRYYRRPRVPDGCEITVTIWAFFKRPPTHFKKDGAALRVFARTARPGAKLDVDNIAKLVLDALNGVAWQDDSWVKDLAVMKRWAAFDETLIEVRWDEPVAA